MTLISSSQTHLFLLYPILHASPVHFAMVAAVKKLRLQSSTAHNSSAGAAPAATGGKKTIEEVYHKKTQLEHILLRPDTYIGSIEKHTQTLWVYEKGEMVSRTAKWPGIHVLVAGDLVAGV
ncbi:DNA topoisomerase 2 [Platanthera zijinensis]|uniref:DNA topoisomerase (ATP-hydrolyzing) n=1 Tax=Platanthera zijinensis TaxID=2320716 RepID=A0AAP0BIL2_9ASPA